MRLSECGNSVLNSTTGPELYQVRTLACAHVSEPEVRRLGPVFELRLGLTRRLYATRHVTLTRATDGDSECITAKLQVEVRIAFSFHMVEPS